MASCRRALRTLGSISILALCTGCSSSDDAPLQSHPGPPQGACDAVETRFETSGGTHVPECSDIEYPMNPPTFGDHYPVWAAYQTYEFPLPSGYWVHSLEHGAVVFLYDCPEGCESEVRELQLFVDELPTDPRCDPNVQRRVIVAPSPGLGARFAAVAWGYSLTASCVDREIFRQFYDDHVASAPEDLCAPGVSIPESACP